MLCFAWPPTPNHDTARGRIARFDCSSSPNSVERTSSLRDSNTRIEQNRAEFETASTPLHLCFGADVHTHTWARQADVGVRRPLRPLHAPVSAPLEPTHAPALISTNAAPLAPRVWDPSAASIEAIQQPIRVVSCPAARRAGCEFRGEPRGVVDFFLMSSLRGPRHFDEVGRDLNQCMLTPEF